MVAPADAVVMGSGGVRPRIKPIYPRYRVTGSCFRIGAQLGITAEFDDPDGQVWELAGLLDGTRSVPEIATAMRTRFPGLSVADVEAGILRLDREGFVEDGRCDGGSPIPPRHLGNVNYFSHFATLSAHRERPQQRLRAATVVLLGVAAARARTSCQSWLRPASDGSLELTTTASRRPISIGNSSTARAMSGR